MILAFFLFAAEGRTGPRRSQNANLVQSQRNYQPTEVLREPIFWLMYFMFVYRGPQAD